MIKLCFLLWCPYSLFDLSIFTTSCYNFSIKDKADIMVVFHVSAFILHRRLALRAPKNNRPRIQDLPGCVPGNQEMNSIINY